MKRYIDIDPEFRTDKNGDIRVVSEDTAIQESIIGLVLTNVFSRPFEPNVRSSVSGLEFSTIGTGDTLTSYMYETAIGEVVSNFETRVDFIRASVNSSKPNHIKVNIAYRLVRDPETELELQFRV